MLVLVFVEITNGYRQSETRSKSKSLVEAVIQSVESPFVSVAAVSSQENLNLRSVHHSESFNTFPIFLNLCFAVS